MRNYLNAFKMKKKIVVKKLIAKSQSMTCYITIQFRRLEETSTRNKIPSDSNPNNDYEVRSQSYKPDFVLNKTKMLQYYNVRNSF